MKDSGNQKPALVTVVDHVTLDCEGPNPRTELWSETTHPRLLGQQFKSFDDGVNQSVGGVGACVLGDVRPDVLEVLLSKSRQPIGHLRLFGARRTTARLDPLGELPT
jgi:hypothetical protein